MWLRVSNTMNLLVKVDFSRESTQKIKMIVKNVDSFWRHKCDEAHILFAMKVLDDI